MAYDRYPAVDEAFKFAPEVRAALATDAVLRNVVVPMTQTQRNNLTGTDLWDGRLIENTTTDRVNRYDAGSDTWKILIETADLTSGLAVVQDDVDGAYDEIAVHESRLDTMDTNHTAGSIGGYTAARIRTTTAGLQDNGFGRKFFDLGFAFRSMPPVITFSRTVSGTEEVDGKVATAFLAYGVVFVTGGDLSLGLSHHITCID
jgi:hypothetical protein